MMNDDLLYQLALTRVPNIGDVHAKVLATFYGNAHAVFKASRKELERIEGIGSIRAASIKKYNDFKTCEDEITFISRYNITPLFITDDNYPKRLLNCYDSPALLFYRGTADLNTSKIISVVGTRNNTSYGKQVCEDLLHALSDLKILVVSGLAFGVDTIAHRSALKNNLSTIAVLAHGLDMIYPSQNKSLARQMTGQGGLLTDFCSNTNPDRQNFPRRNRIVAGLCDALIVIESARSGGSIITAELANSYNKDVFAFPGKTTDTKSVGCNFLIRNNKASLITCADDLLDIMNWREKQKPVIKKQRELFVELSEEEKIITALFARKEILGIDELYLESNLSSSTVASALLMLEMEGIITALPGKMYRLA